MKITQCFTLVCLLLMLSTACNRNDDDDEPTPQLVDPSDANALSEVLIMPAGTESNRGAAPAPSGEAEAPTVANGNVSVTSSNGSTAPLTFSYDNVGDNLGGCYVQIEGADSYFTVPYNATSNTSGDLQLPIGIPANVNEGAFNVNFCVYDNNGLVSNVVTTNIAVLRLGTGSVQVSLSWDNETDQDLYVTGPSGETITYFNTSDSSGGQLDRDDIDGFGPENIFWSENAPDGTYKVEVNDFEGTSTPNRFYITVSTPNESRNFEGTTINGNTVEVVTFTKNGNNIVF